MNTNMIINLLTIGLMVFVYWFFFMKKEGESVEVQEGTVKIIASGGYKPDKITIKKSETTTIIFHREDPSDCMAEVVIPEFGIRENLPLGKDKHITITPKKSGKYQISCGMNMYHGTIEVK